MKINIWINKKDDNFIMGVINDVFNLTTDYTREIYEKRLKKHFDNIDDNCYLVFEAPYVDKVYRDSYYNYYSTKLNIYQKDCIKISIFKNEIKADYFRESRYFELLKNNYCGFIIIRPTVPYLIGRSIISPNALKEHNFMICVVRTETTANSLKLDVEGFPHSSQDAETISCAETTLWAIMEYFGLKYQEYKSVLPSKIGTMLNNKASERLLPTKGLNVDQISYALKEFGFGTKIYSKNFIKEEDFFNLLSCYIESGMPLICALELRHHNGANNEGHAIICIGHVQIEGYMIDSMHKTNVKNEDLNKVIKEKNIELYDYDDIHKQFIFIDDNSPIYHKALLNQPTGHYPGVVSGYEITHFIVPLYTKIYLEAYEAKIFVQTLLLKGKLEGLIPDYGEKEILLRTFLCPSRTFKDTLIKNNTFANDLKNIILESAMPKFIWITEISDRIMLKEKKANGIVILDATEPNTNDNKPLLIAAFRDKLIIKKLTINGEKKEKYFDNFEDYALPLQPYNLFNKNLKEYYDAKNSQQN